MKLETENLLLRYFLSISVIAIMMSVAQIANNSELIFPEIAALTVGAIIIDKSVWRTNKIISIILLTFMALIGTILVIYNPSMPIVNISISFIIAGIVLWGLGVNIPPILSACMLPIVLNMGSWVYPISVLFLSILVYSTQWLCEKIGIRHVYQFTAEREPLLKYSLQWIYMLLLLVGYIIIPLEQKWNYLLLPPLIVTFVEFCKSKSGMRFAPVTVCALIAFAATIGTLGQVFLTINNSWPMAITSTLVIGLVFASFEVAKRYFAPAAAIALVPTILPSNTLFWYPIEVTLGAIFLTSIAYVLFKRI